MSNNKVYFIFVLYLWVGVVNLFYDGIEEVYLGGIIDIYMKLYNVLDIVF